MLSGVLSGFLPDNTAEEMDTPAFKLCPSGEPAMSVRSLLQKASEFRKASGAELMTGGLVFDQSSGISREDQREILKHIDQVAKSSRILAGPDTWKVKPKNRGIMLPIMVNVIGLAIMAGGLFGIRALFSNDTADQTSESVMLSSAEGKLLQEIKREAEGKLQDKDREIAAIQEKMAALDQEREQLASSVETRIKAKEAELRDALKNELEKERQRLIAEGLSEAAIQERLKEFEKKKSEEFKSQLTEFSKKAEAEKLALQADLDRAKSEFNKTLSDATSERQKIQEESRAREQELRAQLNEKDKALEAERARTAQSLDAAQAELGKLNEAASAAKAAEDRLLGLYGSARQALRDGRIDDAESTLKSIKSYTSDPKIASIASLQARRELDLFAMDLIEKSIAAERAKASVDTSQVSAALDALGIITEETRKARSASTSGNAAAALDSYRKALGATKDLQEAGAFIEASWKAQLDQLKAEADAYRAQAESARVAAESRAAEIARAMLDAIAAGPSGETTMSEAFSRLMSSLPLGPGDAGRAWSYIKDAGSRETAASRLAADTAGAAQLFRVAGADLAAGRYYDSFRGYSSVLARFPAAGQAAEAAEGLGRAGEGMVEELRTAREQAATRIADLESRLASTNTKVMSLEGDLTKAAEEAARLSRQITDLQSAVKAADARLTDAEKKALEDKASAEKAAAEKAAAAERAAAAAAAAASGAPTAADYQALMVEKQRLEGELTTAKARYDAIDAAYRAYAREEDSILGAGGDQAIVAARASLDQFFATPGVSAALPGMRDRMTRYMEAFQSAGQQEVLFNAADVVDGATRIADPAIRGRYFQDMKTRYRGNESMLEFLDIVEEALQSF